MSLAVARLESAILPGWYAASGAAVGHSRDPARTHSLARNTQDPQTLTTGARVLVGLNPPLPAREPLTVFRSGKEPVDHLQASSSRCGAAEKWPF